ncbi:MAG: site-specific integrase [Thermomicrobiales bacterium]
MSLEGGKRRSFYGKTRKEAQDKLRGALRDIDAGLDLSAGRQTVAQFLDRWLVDTVQPTVRPKTYDSYAQLVRLYLKPALGHHQLSKLTPQHVQTFIRELEREKKHTAATVEATVRRRLAAGASVEECATLRRALEQEPRLSPRTVQYARAVLRRALGQALKWGLVSRNVATLVDPPRSVKQPVKPLTAEQARQFIACSASDRLGPLFHVAIASGLRQGELFGLRWEDVDLDHGALRVRHALQRVDGVLTLVEPKTALSRRTVTLPGSAVSALRVQKDRQTFERAAAGDLWREGGYVFTSTVGTPLNPSNVAKRLHALLAEAGLPRQRFHDLRHCAASLLLAGGVAPRTIMGILGHSQISLTMNTYAHLSPVLEREAANALDAVLAI